MPLLGHAILAAAFFTIFWSLIGLAAGRLCLLDRRLALAVAPALGWALFDAAALPILLVSGFTRAALASLVLAAAAGAVFTIRRLPRAIDPGDPGIPWWGWLLAALIALGPAGAILPKQVGDGVLLAEPVYDHSKISMIADMARLGLPAGNPYFGAASAPPRLGYYYLWHFSAAIWARLFGITAWEADLGLTWFTAFGSLALMMGLAIRVAGRRCAALWVALLSLSLSLGPLLVASFGAELLYHYLAINAGLQGWLAQASWVPQHLASATSAILAVLLAVSLARSGRWSHCLVLALVAAAGFESSTWIGGVTFAAASGPLGLLLLRRQPAGRRRRLVLQLALAASLAALLALPFLVDEYVATAARHLGVPIAFSPMPVLGPFLPASIGRVLDLPAFWLVFLIVQFPAIYPAGTVVLARAVGHRTGGDPTLAAGLAILAVTGFAIAWLLISTIQNNDLGWRAVLPGVMVLTIFTAAGLAAWLRTRRASAAIAILLLLSGLPQGARQIRDNFMGLPSPDAALFARSPELWAAVRKYAAPDERVGNDPLWLADTVKWPVNISWALFADRRSCFAGWDLARAYVALPGPAIDALEATFERIFAGRGTQEEIHALARSDDCRVIVVTPQDGAWDQDPFATSPDYRLVEEVADRWRIYRVVPG